MSKFYAAAIVVFLAVVLAACGAEATPPRPTHIPAPTFPPTKPLPTFTPVPGEMVIVRAITGDSKPLSVPVDVAFDSKGDLFVLEAGKNRVQVFDPSGKSLYSWGGPGAKPGQFDMLVMEQAIAYGFGGIAIDKNDNVYIADGANHRVQKFDAKGQYISEWGTEGTKDGQFLRPLSLTLDPDGNVYVIDDLASRIQVFDSKGKFLRKFGSEGSGNGQLADTGNIFYAPDGHIYVADFGNKRVQVFTPDGKFFTAWSMTWAPAGIVVDKKGRIFVTDQNGYLTEFDVTGETVQVFRTLALKNPIGIAVDKDGLLYIADQHNNRILVLREHR